MSERYPNGNTEPLSDEEIDALRMNFLYIICGNIPAKTQYYVEKTYKYLYRWTNDRLNALKNDVKKEYRPSGTYELPEELYKFRLIYSSIEAPHQNEGILSKFLKKFSNKELAVALFKTYYDCIWKIFNTHGKDYLEKYKAETGIDFEYEFLAYMYATTGMIAGGKKCRDYVQKQILHLAETTYGWYHLHIDLFNKRCTLYSNIVKKNQVRGEWMLGNASNQPIINAFIAFGDILYNPVCVNNYFNSPMLIPDIFEAAEFAKMMNLVQDKVREFTTKLYKGLK